MPKIEEPDDSALRKLEQALDKLEACQKAVDEACGKATELEQKVEEFKTKVGKPAQDKYNGLVEVCKELAARISTLEKELTLLSEKEKEAADETERARREVDATQAKLQGCKDELAETQRSRLKQERPLETCSKECKDAEEQLAALRKELAALARVIDKKEREYSDTRSADEVLERQIKLRKAERDRLVAEHGAAEEEDKKKLAVKMKKCQEALDELLALLWSSGRHLSDLEDDLDDLRRKRETLESRIWSLEYKLKKQLRPALEKAERRYAETWARESMLKKQCASLSKQLDQDIDKAKAAEERQREATKRRKLKDNELAKAKADHESMEVERKAAGKRLRALKKQFRAMENDAKAAADDCEKATKDLEAALKEAHTQAQAAKQAAKASLDELDGGIKDFGIGLVKVPAKSAGELQEIKKTWASIRNQLAALANLSSPQALLKPLQSIFGALSKAIDAFNTALDGAKAALRAELKEIRQSISDNARKRAGNLWTSAQWINDDLKKERDLRNRIDDLLSEKSRECLLTPKTVEDEALAEVDECVRRFKIFSLKVKYAKMCFQPRLNTVIKPALTDKKTVVQATTAIETLRLAPDIGEWRKCLDIPSSGGWTMWGTKSAFDGWEIHVTMSASSIQLPANQPTAYAGGNQLCAALFTLPQNDRWMEIHGTLNVTVGTTPQGKDAHPAIFFSGGDKYWLELTTLYVNEKKLSQQDAQARTNQAKAAVRALLDKYKATLVTACTTIRKCLNQGEDVLGNQTQ